MLVEINERQLDIVRRYTDALLNDGDIDEMLNLEKRTAAILLVAVQQGDSKAGNADES